MFGNIQWFDMVIILFVVLLIFGPKRLPDLAKSLGSAINEFKGAMSGAAAEKEKVEDIYKRIEKKEAPAEEAKAEAKTEEKPVG